MVIIRSLYIVSAERSSVYANGRIVVPFFNRLIRAGENLILATSCFVEIIDGLGVNIVWQCFHTIGVVPGRFGNRSVAAQICLQTRFCRWAASKF